MDMSQPSDTTTTSQPLTTGAVARLFAVTPSTVVRWADAGLLPSFTTPSGHRRFRLEDVEAFTELAAS